MTPTQNIIVQNISKEDIKTYNALFSWSINKSGHTGFVNFPHLSECQQPEFIKYPNSENNTDESVDETADDKYVSGSFDFSAAQHPSVRTSVYDTDNKFKFNMLN